MIDFLHEIRRPKRISLSRKLLYSTLIFIVGIILGIVSKVLDTIPSNHVPYLLRFLDLGNFFSDMGIWLFLAVVISVYSQSPIRSAINVFLFFVGMVGSYYLYTVLVAGFFPKSYMMIWVVMTVISPFLAIVSWYAKGEGVIAIFISAIIFVFISRQTFAFGFWYFDIKNRLEFLLWIATFFVLFKSSKQITSVAAIGFILLLLTAQINILWGML